MRFHRIRAIAGVVIRELARRKDFYVLFILTAAVTLLAGSASFFNDDRIVRYLKELCLLFIWISSLVIAITMAARQIHAERENRTLLPLLAKPVSRAEVILGKFLGCWLACGAALLCFYLFFSLVAATREQSLPGAIVLQAVLSHWVLLGVVIALTLLASMVFSAPSATATVCFIVTMGLLLMGRHLGKIALRLHEPGQSLLQAVYFSIPQLAFFDLRERVIHGHVMVSPWAWGVSLGYGLVYTGLFVLAACALFRRKPVN